MSAEYSPPPSPLGSPPAYQGTLLRKSRHLVCEPIVLGPTYHRGTLALCDELVGRDSFYLLLSLLASTVLDSRTSDECLQKSRRG